MPHIEPLPLEQITDPDLLDLIAQCERLGVPDALLPRILARVPTYAKASNGGSMSVEDKAWCEQLKSYYNDHLGRAARAPTRLQNTNSLEDALYFLNAARGAGCPWAKTATIPW